MKKATTTPTNLMLKALDLQLKALLQEDLRAFRAKQIRAQKVAA